MEEHIRCQSMKSKLYYSSISVPSTTGTDQARALELLSQLPSPAAVKNEEGRTLLHWACRNKWGEVAHEEQ